MTVAPVREAAMPLVELRHLLHERPELSRHEAETAALVAAQMRAAGADTVLERVGGHGVAAILQSGHPGPTICLRAELDALPITEAADRSPRSRRAGVAHLCGHDGHMAMLVGAVRALAADRPPRGRIVALFQPAEEDGSGAAAVAADPRFRALGIDFAFALHNLPDLPLGTLAIAEGPTTCASRGMRLRFLGRTSHAANPERSVSPMTALATLMPALAGLRQGAGPEDPDFALVTITHARMGAEAFGITPGEGTLLATLRTRDDPQMEALVTRALDLVARHAEYIPHEVTWDDVFVAMRSAPAAVAVMTRAVRELGNPVDESLLPSRGSEDFGGLGVPKSALAFIGAGEGPPLHAPDYVFPDALIPIGAAVLERTARLAASAA